MKKILLFFLLTGSFVMVKAQMGAWVQKTDIGSAIANGGSQGMISAIGFGMGDKGYGGAGSGTKNFYRFDPASGHWQKKADAGGSPRSGGVGFSIGSKGYIG